MVEALVGRQLTEAEKAIDVVGIDRKLARAKDDLQAAIEREKDRVIRRRVRGQRARMELTQPMVDVLGELYRFGRAEALAELKRLGYSLRRAHATAEQLDYPDDLDELVKMLQVLLGSITIRIEKGLVEADVSAVGHSAVIRQLMRLPGTRDVASQVISTALASGLGATFEENENLVGGWQYTAVLDGGTCDPCSSKDGTIYRTWAEAQADLPGGGPYSGCRGGGRCRCRVVPLRA